MYSIGVFKEYCMRTILLVALFGCRTDSTKITTEIVDSSEPLVDLDGDGFLSDEDCDDSSATIYPGASEICDGLDNDCDGEVDNGVLDHFYLDSDADGFGDPLESLEICEAPEGYSSNGNDCDDSSDDSYPGAPEQCDDLDNDCDGEVDEDLVERWYVDSDLDGFGDVEEWVDTCLPGENYVADSSDCDDIDPDIHPDAEEICDYIDNDCDSVVDEDVLLTFFVDADGDGFGDDFSVIDDCQVSTGTSWWGGIAMISIPRSILVFWSIAMVLTTIVMGWLMR
jgi:hypothetical protein